MSAWHLSWKNLGRNDPCWCGQGRKYKHCHLRIEEQDTPEQIRRSEQERSAAASGHAHLYHYTNTRNWSWIEDILLQNRLYFRLPVELNDPFEARISSDFAATLAEHRRYYFNKLKVQYDLGDDEACRLTDQWIASGENEDPEFWENEEELMIEQGRERDFRLFCLTPHERNLLMWSHYGDSHRGVEILSIVVDEVRAYPHELSGFF